MYIHASKKTSGHGMIVQDKDGLLLQDPRELRGRWKEYVEDYIGA